MSGIPRSDSGDDFLILDVYEAGGIFKEQDIEDIYESVHKIIKNVPGYKSPQEGISLEQYLISASFLRPDVRNFYYNFNDVVIKPQIDLIRYYKKSIHVIDWKVSDNEDTDYSRQLTLEGIVAMHYSKNWFKKNEWEPLPILENVNLFEINLLNGDIKSYPFTKESTAMALDYVYSYRNEQEQLSHQKSWNELDILDYEKTDKVETCSNCKFKNLCKHLIKNKHTYDENEYNKLVQVAKLA